MQNRIRFVLIILSAGYLIVLARLSYWQVFGNKKLRFLASNQYRHISTKLPERGQIFTNDGFPLVMNARSFLLFADPSKLQISPEEVLEKLEKYLVGKKVDKKLLSNKSLYWVFLKDNLIEKEKTEIESLGIEGLNFETKSIRYYPEASMSAHLLGFVGSDEKDDSRGYFGVEGYYDKELRGKSGDFYFEKDAIGRPIPLGKIFEEKLVSGRDLVLNINRGLQYLVEKKLLEGISTYKASSGSVTIMDPQTGAILAMASKPDFVLEKYFQFEEEVYRNPVVSSLFEPGSIFKVLVMAAALDSESVELNEICTECSGPKNIADYSIKTWNDKYYPNSSLTDILVHSDNVGMVFVAKKLGTKKLLEYFDRFGLLERTNIDLQGEISPSIKPEKDWREIDLATASFGQGIALTQIQMLMAVCAIANGGQLYQPEVVDTIKENDEVIEIKPLKLNQPISSKTADEIKEMMVQAVKKGEAKWANPEGYKIAGKTGTAQIPIEGHYDPEKTIASFIGFAPADEPKFVMLVVLNEPQTSPWGSETAAPLWFSISKDIFRLLRIKPSLGEE